MQLLVRRRVVMHPFVFGELIAGSLPSRTETQRKLAVLPMLPLSQHDDVVELLNRFKLHGIGLSWIDLHVLCSVRTAGARLITGDQALATAARRLGVPGA